MDFISELVASTDDEDFAVLLADVECLPDEVLETLAAVVQVRRAGVDRRDDELGQPFAAGRDVAAAVLHPDRHPCPRCDTDDDLDGAEAPRGLAENLAQTAKKQGRKAKCGDREWVWEPCEPWSGAPPDARQQAYLDAVLTGKSQKVAAAPAGERNWTLFVAALKCATYVTGAGLDEQKVRDALEDAAEKCGLAEDDGPKAVSATIARL